MESQPQNPEFRNNPENFHPCTAILLDALSINILVLLKDIILWCLILFWVISTLLVLTDSAQYSKNLS